jgi:hypothetical protein
MRRRNATRRDLTTPPLPVTGYINATCRVQCDSDTATVLEPCPDIATLPFDMAAPPLPDVVVDALLPIPLAVPFSVPPPAPEAVLVVLAGPFVELVLPLAVSPALAA